MPTDNILMLTYPGWDSPGGGAPILDPGALALDLPSDTIVQALMAGRPIVILVPPDSGTQTADAAVAAVDEEDAEDVAAREKARAEAKQTAAALRRQQDLLRQQLKQAAALAAAQANLERRQLQQAQQALMSAERDAAHKARADEARRDLLKHYQAMLDLIGQRPAVQTAFNTKLTAIHTTITLAPLAADTEKNVLQLKRDVAIAVIEYDRALAAWKPALRVTKERIGFIVTAKDKQTQLEALAALKVLIRQDPFDKGVAATEFDKRTLRKRLKEVNDRITWLVRFEEKTRRKEAIFKELRDTFVEAMGRNQVPDKKYTDLPESKKSLIRAVREGSNPGAPVNNQYYWERKNHEFRKGMSGNAPTLKGKGSKFEYRLHKSTNGGATYTLTGERMTSVGTPNSDHILFFDIQHPNEKEYQYGLVTRLPLRRTNKAQPNTDVVEPSGFPAAPADVVLP